MPLLLTGAAAQPDAARQALVAMVTDAGQEIVAADGAGFPVWRAALAGRTLWEQWRETPSLVRALRTFIETGPMAQCHPIRAAGRRQSVCSIASWDRHWTVMHRWLRWYSRRQRRWRRPGGITLAVGARRDLPPAPSLQGKGVLAVLRRNGVPTLPDQRRWSG